MDSGSVFFLLAIVVIVLLIITQPFARKREETVKDESYFAPLERVQDDYQAALGSIRELNGDFQQGKLSQADYDVQKAILEEQALALLEKLNEPSKSGNRVKENHEREIEAMIHTRRQVRQEQTAGFCPKCGKPVQKSDQFCPSCGEQTHLYL